MGQTTKAKPLIDKLGIRHLPDDQPLYEGCSEHKQMYKRHLNAENRDRSYRKTDKAAAEELELLISQIQNSKPDEKFLEC